MVGAWPGEFRAGRPRVCGRIEYLGRGVGAGADLHRMHPTGDEHFPVGKECQ